MAGLARDRTFSASEHTVRRLAADRLGQDGDYNHGGDDRSPHLAMKLLFDNLEELDFEHECRAWLDHRWGALIAVGQSRWAHQLALAAYLDLLHPLGPTLDDLIQSERGRLAPLDRTVKNGAVDEGAVIVHFHCVGRFRVRPFPFLDRGENGPGFGFLRTGFCSGLREKRGPCFLLDFRRSCAARLLELLTFRPESLEVHLGRSLEDPIGETRFDEIQFGLAQRETAE